MNASVQASGNAGIPRINARRRWLLGLLDALGGSAGNLDLQKLLFLYCQELESSPQGKDESWYEFVPYQYGAFSLTCYADRRRLVDFDLLMDNGHWELTGHGKQIGRQAQDASMCRFAKRYKGLRGNLLIAETYRRYPYYAIRSEMAAQVLGDDAAALREIAAERPTGARSQLMTIGYERRSLENYLNRLLRAGVTVLCDVRKNAISRKYGFSRKTLAHACQIVGVQYEHMPELGVESRQRRGLQTQEDYSALFTTYKRHNLPRQRQAVKKIYLRLQAGESVALTCYEREADQCHRHCIAAELEQMHNQGVLFGTPDASMPVGRNSRPGSNKGALTVRHL